MAGFNTAVTGIKATTTALDVTGNNIANSSTVGFKATRAEFGDIYATQVVGAGSQNIAGSGVLISDLSQDFSSGTIEFTNSNLDLAINGSGFFQLDDGQGGTTYTRAGAFKLDKEGNIISKNGKYLQGYSLDAQGNQGVLGKLQVTEKESPPHATENIRLSVNLEPEEKLHENSDYYTKTDSKSYSYTTTVKTFDSLGNEHAIRFNYVEQKAQREYHQYDIATGALAVNGQPPVNPTTSGPAGALEANVFTLSGVPLSWELGPYTPTAAQITAAQNYITGLNVSTDLAGNWGAGTVGTAGDPVDDNQAVLHGAAANLVAAVASNATQADQEAAVQNYLNSLTSWNTTGASPFTTVDPADVTTIVNGINAEIAAPTPKARATGRLDSATSPVASSVLSDAHWGEFKGAGTAKIDTLVDAVLNNPGDLAQQRTDMKAALGAPATAYTAPAPTIDDAMADAFIAAVQAGLGGGPDYVLTSDTIRALEAADPRIDTATVRFIPQNSAASPSQPARIEYKLKSDATGQGDVVLAMGDGTVQDPMAISNVDSQGRPTLAEANESMTLTLAEPGTAPFSATGGLVGTGGVDIEIGGVKIHIPEGSDVKAAGRRIVDQYEQEIKNNDPNIESVTYDEATNKLKITWKAEAGDVYTGASKFTVDGNSNETTDANSLFVTAGTGNGALQMEMVEGDNSYLGAYRVYAYLNDDQLLNIGKAIDPGESGASPALPGFVPGAPFSEPGPVMIKFSPTTGLIESINGEPVRDQSSVPKLTIRGADQANPDDTLLEDDIDSLRGLQFDISGTTRWESDSIVKKKEQDGYPKGDLVGVSFDEQGRMVASYSNGQKKDIGIVALATFESQSGLQPAGDTEWVATLESGQASLNPPGTGLNGTIRSGALEQSNVDLSAELVKLIELQRNYQANSKTLETLNTVTQSILQI